MENEKQNIETPEKALSIVDEAKKVRDEIKAENDRREQILANEQRLQAQRMLGSSAGSQITPVAPKVDTAKEYADKVMRGEIKAQ